MKLIVFDIGNVICSVDIVRTAVALSKRFPCGVSADQVVTLAREMRFAQGGSSGKEFHRQLTASLGYQAGYQQFVEDWNCCMGEIADGIESLIRDLQAAGHRLAILSDNNPLHWGYCLENFPQVLAPFVGHIFLSFQIGSCKPSPEAFRTVEECERLPGSEIVFIDDLQKNIEGAARCGWTGIQHVSVQETREQLSRLGLL